MELKLNIYDENEKVVKTYVRESYSIKMRLLKNIITLVDFDTLFQSMKEGSNESNMLFVTLVTDVVMKSYDLIQELMKKVFPGLTDEEYLDTNLNEIVEVVINLVRYSFTTIGMAGKNSKN